MFKPHFEQRAKRKRPATGVLEYHHERAEQSSSSDWTRRIHHLSRLDQHDQDFSRRTRPIPVLSASWSLGEDRRYRVSERDSSNLGLKPWRSTHRQDGSQQFGSVSSYVNNSGSSTVQQTGGGYELKRGRSRLSERRFQGATEKTTVYGEPAAKYQRFDPFSRNLLEAVGEISRPGTAEKSIRHELTHPEIAAGVEVLYTKDLLQAEKWIRKHIVDCSARAVGFDIEWKPQFVSKKKGGAENRPAVLQLGVEASCLVLHIFHMSELPRSLVAILRDEKVLKIGSGIRQDGSKLTRDRGLVCTGLVDTQEMAKSLGRFAPERVGLKALAERFLGIEFIKPNSITMSNWEIFPLKPKQIEYAALDAWIGLIIYQEMKRQKSSKVSVW